DDPTLVPSADDLASHDEATRRRAADLLLLSQMIARVLKPDVSGDEARIARVLAAIKSEAATEEPAATETFATTPTNSAVPTNEAGPAIPRTEPARRFPWTRVWLGLLATAALIPLALWLNHNPPAASAQAAVQQAAQAAEAAVAHRYQIHITAQAPLAKWSWDAQVDVRGPEHFVLTYPTPVGQFAVGTDGHECWVVPALPFAPVQVARDKGNFKDWLREGGPTDVAQPFLDLHSILEHIGSSYSLTLLEAGALPESKPVPQGAFNDRAGTWTHVRGVPKGDPGLWADSIEVWSDPKTGRAVRIALNWNHRGLAPQPRTITLQLDPFSDWPEDWFRHTAHHTPERAVVRSD
ncbi:MAG TPA: hypothetical protein VGE52_20715, partial [Pirellulales bacterium]